MTQLEEANFNGTGTVVHPKDWEAMQLTKDSTSNYIIGAPQGANPPTLWNRPVVVTSAITEGDFLCGAFDQAALIYDRMAPRLDIGTTDDDFIRNMVVLRFETRLGHAILRPGALIKGEFGGS
jgi:HK97 family phage major capsid protein